MIKPAGLVLGVVMAAVTAGTYYGLDYVPLPPPLGRTPPPEPPKVGEAKQVADAGAATGAAKPAEAAPAPAAEEPMTEADLAEEPPPQPEAAPSAPTQVAQAEEPAPAAESEPAPEPKAAPAAPAPAPDEKPEPGWGKESGAASAPAAESKPKAAAAKPAPKPAAKAPARASGEPDVEYAPPKETPDGAASQSASAAPVTPVKPKPEADVIKPWWPDPAKMPANQLKLQYAGQVQGQQAIALLFSAPLNVDTLKQHAQIRTVDGKTVGGTWELGKNPRLAVFKGVKPGRYTIILEPQVADAKGFMLGTKLQGPVYIQEPH